MKTLAVANIRESNRIEGILRDPTLAEIDEYIRFLNLKAVSVVDLEHFVSVYEPGAYIRPFGYNVFVGNHSAPSGGPYIRDHLQDIVDRVNGNSPETTNAWKTHIEYETLHPFTDCNGRSGRMLWYWMMRADPIALQRGFLHTFYYQTFDEVRT